MKNDERDDYRKLVVKLHEESRRCSHCGKRLAHCDNTIMISIVISQFFAEYCGWFCLFKGIKQMVADKLLNKKLQKNNLLAELQYDANETNIKKRLKREGGKCSEQ